MKTIAQMYREKTKQYPSFPVQMEKNKSGEFVEKSYLQLEDDVFALAVSLKKMGIERQQLIGLISDNCGNWLLSDLALQFIGAVDVPRGSDATDLELVEILGITETKICFAGDDQIAKRLIGLKDKLPNLKTIINLNQKAKLDSDLEIINIDDLLAEGKSLILSDPKYRLEIIEEVNNGSSEELATIIFTSGTTGLCKGVMLTQDNFIFEVSKVEDFVDGKFKPGQKWLSVLPIWHSFERAVTYTALYNNHCICYSKPLGKIMLKDFKLVNPQWFSSVPRIWQTINKGIESKINKEKGLKKKLGKLFIKSAKSYKKAYNLLHGLLPVYDDKSLLGKKFVAIFKMIYNYPLYSLGKVMLFNKVKSTLGTSFVMGISGGGSLPKDVDEFFNAIGINLLDGYGMTETSPIISVRDFAKPIIGTMNIVDTTEIKIVDENNSDVSIGEKGVLKIRGRQVMKGYYKNEAATSQILDREGWLNTGDLVIKSKQGGISVVGRAKDTIVLAGGENLEPVPIEGKMSEVEYIENAVVIGQDRKYLSALIVPNLNAIKEHFANLGKTYNAEKEEIQKFIHEQINEKVNLKFGFKPYELINKITLLDKPFEIGKELSAKQELKRFEIEKVYCNEINNMYVV